MNKTLRDQCENGTQCYDEFIMDHLLKDIPPSVCIWCDVKDAAVKLIETEFFPDMPAGFIEGSSWYDGIIAGIVRAGMEAARLQQKLEQSE